MYNSSGYESPETLKLLEGIIDIYLPDWKYAEESVGKLYSNAPDYPSVCQAAVKEMYRQVGDLTVDDNEIALRGLIIRHLVLPHHLTNSEKVLGLIRAAFSRSIRVSLMSQYAPRFRAQDHSLINRPLNQEEYQEIKKAMERLEFEEYWIQELESQEVFFPDFKSTNPFLSPQGLNTPSALSPLIDQYQPDRKGRIPLGKILRIRAVALHIMVPAQAGREFNKVNAKGLFHTRFSDRGESADPGFDFLTMLKFFTENREAGAKVAVNRKVVTIIKSNTFYRITHAIAIAPKRT